MALESFYGGKPGYSPIIKGTFKSIAEMDDHFKEPNYTDIWYGELCIITPDSMYDADNGKIFRRTLKKQFSSDTTYGSLYAEYLGQIVGMPGGLPKVVFNTIDNVKNIPSQEENRNKDIWYPISPDNEYIETSNDRSSINNWATLNGSEAEGIEFVPGMQKVSDNEIIYNDKFEYTWLQIADPQSNTAESDGTRGTLHLGLKIPYLTMESEAKSISYIKNANASIKETNTDIDGIEHPFYRKYTFSIPDGVRGIGIQNLRIETKDSLKIVGQNTKVLDPTKNIFNYDENNRDIRIETEGNYYNFDTTKYGENSPFWVYDLIVPRRSDSSLNPTTSYICYAGDYEGITDVTLNNDGTFTFNTGYNEITTDNIDNTGNSKVKWITNASIDTNIKSINSETGLKEDNKDYGNFTITYNTKKQPVNENEAEEYEKNVYKLPLVKRIVAYSNVSNNNNENSNNNTNSPGENISVELVDSTGGTRSLTLLKSTGQDSYDTYKLKYPCSLAITTHNNSNSDDQENGDSDNQENENSDSQETTKDPFYYLTVTYNDGITTEELGPVGVQNVDKLASYIAIGEEKTIIDPNTSSNIITVEKISNYLPEVAQENAIMLIDENITFDTTLSFLPSFSLGNTTTQDT